MVKRKHTAEEIINKLREAEVVIAAGSTVVEAARRIGVSEQTFYRWRAEYGGLRIDQVRRLKQLEKGVNLLWVERKTLLVRSQPDLPAAALPPET